MNQYIQEEVDEFIESGKGRKSQEAIEERRQQLEERIARNINNVPTAYVAKQKKNIMKGSGLMAIPFLDKFSLL